MFDTVKKMTIEDKLRATFSGVAIGTRLGRREIVFKVVSAYPDVGENSVLPSDRCYNITNADFLTTIASGFSSFSARGRTVTSANGIPTVAR